MKKISSLLLPVFFFAFIACNNGDEINFIEESGTIETEEVVVSSKIAGQIIKKIFDDGDFVKRGDTLLIVDYEELKLQLIQANAKTEIAGAQLKLMEIGARSEDKNQAVEMLKQAEANFNIAKLDFDRIKNLADSKSVTKKQLDDADARLQIAAAQVNSAKENLKKIKNIAREEEIIQARANLKLTEANRDLIKKKIKDCFVVSPISGFIVKSFSEEGEIVNYLSSLYKISNLEITELEVYVPEAKLGSLKLNQKADVFVDSFTDKAFEGKVKYISSEAEFTPKNIQTKDERTKLVFAVKIEVPNPDFELKTGMPADAKIYLN